jgi:replicative DNA helicase
VSVAEGEDPGARFAALVAAQKAANRRHLTDVSAGAPAVRGDYPVDGGTPYSLAALADEVATLRAATIGTRNGALNTAAFKLGRHVGAGTLDEQLVRQELAAAVASFGDWDPQSRSFEATFRSGIEAGKTDPRHAPPFAPATASVWTPPPPGVDPITGEIDSTAAAAATAAPAQFVTGGAWILDQPDKLPTVWGAGDEVLWAAGESLIISGQPGTGKTTLLQQVVLARLGLADEVLGWPVTAASRTLYLAMDRPRQIARSFRRMVHPDWRETLDERLVIWQGPPPGDLATHPELLDQMVTAARVDTVILDSLKDAAVGLTKDEVAAGINRAIQTVLARSVEVAITHHQTKRGPGGIGKALGLGDVYGSQWITSGAGSVVILVGDAGDPVVEFRHVKSPSAEVGPFHIVHDSALGRSEIYHDEKTVDPLQFLRMRVEGTNARALAAAMFSVDEPDRAQVMKAMRKLQALAEAGLATSMTSVGVRGGRPQQTFWPSITPPITPGRTA